MTNDKSVPGQQGNEDDAADLIVRRHLPVTPERAFAAWTDPHELQQWWGPSGVRCVAAEIDLSVGGHYRIGNELPDKSIVWIEGVFTLVNAPRRLEYTWCTDPDADSKEHVAVSFDALDGGTRITILHSRIPNDRIRNDHKAGWGGCLDGLGSHLDS